VCTIIGNGRQYASRPRRVERPQAGERETLPLVGALLQNRGLLPTGGMGRDETKSLRGGRTRPGP